MFDWLKFRRGMKVARPATSPVPRVELARRARAQAFTEELTHKYWITDGAVDPCDVCKKNESESTLPIGAVFPSGHDTYPAHDGCSCWVNYTLDPLPDDVLNATIG